MPTKQSIAEQPRANTKKASKELERAIANLGKAGKGAGAITNNYMRLRLTMAPASGHAYSPTAAAITA